MKIQMVFDELGKELAARYEAFGFKLRDRNRQLVRKTKEYEYCIKLHSFHGNGKGRSVNTVFRINAKCPKTEQLLYIDLWKLGVYLHVVDELSDQYQDEQIGNNEILYFDLNHLEKAVGIITPYIDEILIPFIKFFEEEPELHKQQWIESGFLSHLPNKYHFDDGIFAYTTHVHYWIDTEFRKKYNEFGFSINLQYIAYHFGLDAAKETLRNYLYSLNPKHLQFFLQYFDAELKAKQTNKMPRSGLVYGEYPNITIVDDALDLEINPMELIQQCN